MQTSTFHGKSPRPRVIQYAVCAVFLLLCAGMLRGTNTLQAQSGATDPGPRGGAASAGGFYPTLNANEQAFFNAAKIRFQEVDSVSGTIAGEDGSGLGPTFNGNSCAQCHAQPTIGGVSPGPTSPQHPINNPQVALAKLDGATNTVPAFITNAGPVREARFILNLQTGLTDGGVHDLYTIQGRSDAAGCVLAQPNFTQAINNANIIFRTPTPLFGLGLVENTSDITLQNNLAANANAKNNLGIAGKLNTSGNDGTVTKFGWKAQNKSLLIFAGEAYNVEQGVSNENFTNERSAVAGCVFNGTPEDASPGVSSPVEPENNNEASDASSDMINFAGFMRLSAPPTQVINPQNQQAIATGQSLFSQIGCNLCHTPSLTTAKSPFTGMSNVTYAPYSDFAVHHMGSTLADGVTQGAAGPDEFRTAPLWGVGQRLFFLHDGRTQNLVTAIEDHFSNPNDCAETVTAEQFDAFALTNGFTVNGQEFQYTPTEAVDEFCGSEANAVVRAFNNLSTTQQNDIILFLRSL